MMCCHRSRAMTASRRSGCCRRARRIAYGRPYSMRRCTAWARRLVRPAPSQFNEQLLTGIRDRQREGGRAQPATPIHGLECQPQSRSPVEVPVEPHRPRRRVRAILTEQAVQCGLEREEYVRQDLLAEHDRRRLEAERALAEAELEYVERAAE